MYKYRRAIFILFVLLVGGFVCQCQNLHIKSKVIDADSGEALPWASVMVLNASAGATADIMGDFSLLLNEDMRYDTLVISYMGYESRKICICDLDSEGIGLTSKVFQLETFHYLPRKKNNIVLNPFRKRNCYVPYTNTLTEDETLWVPYRPHEPAIEAVYFPPGKNAAPDSFIREVWLFTRSWSHPAFFRLRVMRADDLKRPAEDILTENVIIEVNQRVQLVKYNLEEHHLTFPENGVFVGFELMIIPENKRKFRLPDDTISVALYSPYLQYFPAPEREQTYWIYTQGNWKEQYVEMPSAKNGERSKPAISLVIE